MASGNQGKGGLYLIIGALLVGVIALGYVVYDNTANEPDLEISVDENGIEIDGN